MTANSNNEADKQISTSPFQSITAYHTDEAFTSELTPDKVNLKWRRNVSFFK